MLKEKKQPLHLIVGTSEMLSVSPNEHIYRLGKIKQPKKLTKNTTSLHTTVTIGPFFG